MSKKTEHNLELYVLGLAAFTYTAQGTTSTYSLWDCAIGLTMLCLAFSIPYPNARALKFAHASSCGIAFVTMVGLPFEIFLHYTMELEGDRRPLIDLPDYITSKNIDEGLYLDDAIWFVLWLTATFASLFLLKHSKKTIKEPKPSM